jgi:hypothetical protein
LRKQIKDNIDNDLMKDEVLKEIPKVGRRSSRYFSEVVR